MYTIRMGLVEVRYVDMGQFELAVDRTQRWCYSNLNSFTRTLDI
jgi:hypothetical protein